MNRNLLIIIILIIQQFSCNVKNKFSNEELIIQSISDFERSSPNLDYSFDIDSALVLVTNKDVVESSIRFFLQKKEEQLSDSKKELITELLKSDVSIKYDLLNRKSNGKLLNANNSSNEQIPCLYVTSGFVKEESKAVTYIEANCSNKFGKGVLIFYSFRNGTWVLDEILRVWSSGSTLQSTSNE